MRFSFLLFVVLVGMFGSPSYGGEGLPFDPGDVSRIRFRYTYEDTDQVVINDLSRVQAIISTLQVELKEACECVHNKEVLLTIDGTEHVASVCSHCFDMIGQYRGRWAMPVEFFELMEAYRDSTRLREPWNGKAGLGK